MGKWCKKIAVLGAVILGLWLLGGCGNASDNSGSASQSMESALPAADMAVGDQASNEAADGGMELGEARSMDKSVAEKSDAAVGTEEAESSGGGTGSSAGAGEGKRTANAAAGAGQTSPGFQGATADTGFNKKLIYRANVVMEVEDYAKAQSEIRNLVALTGGYIVEFSENQSQHELGGNFILKLPAAGFSPFLDKLEQLKPKSMQRTIQGQDVSEEYVDLESRLKVKEAMEARYLKFVEEATQTSQLVKFVNELERIQTEIEQIKGRMRYIDSNVAYSTVEIRLYQPEQAGSAMAEGDEPPLLERAKQALTGSIEVLSLILQWLIVLLAGALPVIAIAAVIVVPLWLLRRRQAQNRAEEREARKQANGMAAQSRP
ncbi:DUF4349 domain-containing protein, partial [Paenibacillus macerans]|uniref:DUF4349 domain-containing protein n=1 Tax=Paenibacillus macerans TaxID=44252 RepID=UPI002E2145CB|nr:DUF4349 domain-containing protein [Paenibacillus macerans]